VCAVPKFLTTEKTNGMYVRLFAHKQLYSGGRRCNKEETKNILCNARGRVRYEFLAEFRCYRLRLCTWNFKVMYMRDQL